MTDIIRPEDYIISRKRKKYKFAKFYNSRLCFEYDEWQKRQVDVIEIGAGNGLFSVELASKNPNQYFVAVDVKGDRLQKGATEADLRGLKNVAFVRARADQISDLFSAKTVQAIWLTFPDPFPKKRSGGRRLTHATFLKYYADLLSSSGRLYLKHDNPEFFKWSLEQVVASNWHIGELSFDLHESELDDDYKIKTTYEKRWLTEGKPTQFFSAWYNK